MTQRDLKAKYHRDTGIYAPNELLLPYDIRDYIKWLEENLIKLLELKQKLIPWEKI